MCFISSFSIIGCKCYTIKKIIFTAVTLTNTMSGFADDGGGYNKIIDEIHDELLDQKLYLKKLNFLLIQ